MCKQCEKNPVYEFTNKRKVCRGCFIHWFQKKVLYIIRKFEMVKKGDVIAYVKGKSFRDVVLEDVLKIYVSKGHVELLVCGSCSIFNAQPNRKPSLLARSTNKSIDKRRKRSLDKLDRKRGDNFLKIAISFTADVETYELVDELFNGKMKKHLPVEGKIIKPLYLFLDKEVLLYAKLKNLKFKKEKENSNELVEFIDDLEKKHPELKQAVVKGILELDN
jgi:hypothetical protein